MNTTLHQKRRLAILGYTENPQADGSCCPYITLPVDYFPRSNQHQRTEQVSYWMPRLMAVLGVSQPEAQV